MTNNNYNAQNQMPLQGGGYPSLPQGGDFPNFLQYEMFSGAEEEAPVAEEELPIVTKPAPSFPKKVKNLVFSCGRAIWKRLSGLFSS